MRLRRIGRRLPSAFWTNDVQSVPSLPEAWRAVGALLASGRIATPGVVAASIPGRLARLHPGIAHANRHVGTQARIWIPLGLVGADPLGSRRHRSSHSRPGNARPSEEHDPSEATFKLSPGQRGAALHYSSPPRSCTIATAESGPAPGRATSGGRFGERMARSLGFGRPLGTSVTDKATGEMHESFIHAHVGHAECPSPDRCRIAQAPIRSSGAPELNKTSGASSPDRTIEDVDHLAHGHESGGGDVQTLNLQP